MAKKITLKAKDSNNTVLYPQTITDQVHDSAGQTLTSVITAVNTKITNVINGTTTVGKATTADNATKVSNKLKLKDTTGATKEFDGSAGVDLSGGVNYAATAGSANVANAIKDDIGGNKTWSDIDEYIGQEIGDASEEIYAAIQKLKDDIAGGSVDITIPMASDAADGYGISRLATLYDVQSQNDSSSNDASVAVTPNTLWRYLQSIKGTNNGIASLDETGKVPSSQLPSYVDDIIEFANKSAFPPTGESSKIYVDLSANKTYRWGGTEYVAILDSLAIGETTGTAYDGAKGKANADAISALQTRVGTAEGGITTINGEITKLKTKDESHDASFRNLDTNKADKTTVTNLQNKVNGIETTTNANNTKLTNIIGTGNPDTDYGDSNTTQSVALAVRAIADDEGNQFSTKYAKKTDIKEVDKATVEGLIGVSGLTYSEYGTVTY